MDRKRMDRSASDAEVAKGDPVPYEYVRLGERKRKSCGSDLRLHGRICLLLDLETGKETRDACILAIPSKVPERWIPEAIRSSMWEQDITAMRELPGSLW